MNWSVFFYVIGVSSAVFGYVMATAMVAVWAHDNIGDGWDVVAVMAMIIVGVATVAGLAVAP